MYIANLCPVVWKTSRFSSFCSHKSAVAFRDFRLYFFYYLRISSPFSVQPFDFQYEARNKKRMPRC